MNEIFIVFIVTAILISGFKLINGMELSAYILAIGVTFIATLFVWGLSAFNFSAMDTEIWNGEISNKRNIVKECPWGWNRSKDDFCTEYRSKEVYDGKTCTTDSKTKKKSCVNNYHTEYKYDYPWEGKWFVYSANLKESWEIGRVDYQGANEPGEYRQVKIGDPASTTNSYSNWIKAASDSVFHEDGGLEEKYKEFIPEYPIKIYDRFKVDRIVSVGVTIPDIAKHNHRLSVALKQLGPKKQMNAVIVVVDASKIPNAEYAYAVRRAWNGFKKNDAVTFVGVNAGKIEWAEVLSWSKASIFDVELRDKILADRGKALDLNNVISYIETIGMQSYERRSMKEFEFLKDEIATPMWLIILAAIVNAIAIFVTIFVTRKVQTNHVYR